MHLPPRLRMAKQRLPPIPNRTISTTLSVPIPSPPPDNAPSMSTLADAFPNYSCDMPIRRIGVSKSSSIPQILNEPDIIWAAYEDFHPLLPSAPREHEQIYTPRHALRRSVPNWRSVRRQTERWARLTSPHPVEYRMRTFFARHTRDWPHSKVV